MKSLSIITLNWNTKVLTNQCVEGWVAQAEECVGGGVVKSAQMIVVENGSTDGSVEMLRKLEIRNLKLRNKTDLKVIFNQENVGFARGNNQGIKVAKGEYVLLVNSDTVPKPGALKILVQFLDNHQEASIVGPRLVFPDERGVQRSVGAFPNLPVVFVMLFAEHFGGNDYVRRAPEKIERVDWLVGATVLVRREVFDKAGGLDEQIFMYFEEVEWFYRTWLAGFETWFTPEAEVVHFERASSGFNKSRPIIMICSGLLYFYRKHKSKWQYWLVWLMIKKKALLSYGVGVITNNRYLKETYREVLKES